MNNKTIKITALAIVTIVIVSIGSFYLFSSSKTAFEAPVDDLKSSAIVSVSNHEVSSTNKVKVESKKKTDENPVKNLKEKETKNTKPEMVPVPKNSIVEPAIESNLATKTSEKKVSEVSENKKNILPQDMPFIVENSIPQAHSSDSVQQSAQINEPSFAEEKTVSEILVPQDTTSEPPVTPVLLRRMITLFL